MYTASSISKYSYEIYEINGVDIEWEKYIFSLWEKESDE